MRVELEGRVAEMEARAKEEEEKEEKKGGRLQKLMGIEEIDLGKDRTKKGKEYFIRHQFMDELEGGEMAQGGVLDKGEVHQGREELVRMLGRKQGGGVVSGEIGQSEISQNGGVASSGLTSRRTRLRLDEETFDPTEKLTVEEEVKGKTRVTEEGSEEVDPLDAYMSAISGEGVEQEIFNMEAVRNQSRAIEDRKEGELTAIIEEEDEEEELEVVEVMTQEQLRKLFGADLYEVETNPGEKDQDGFFVPGKKQKKDTGDFGIETEIANGEEAENGQKEEIGESESEEEVEYDEEDSQFIQALKNSNLLFSATKEVLMGEDGGEASIQEETQVPVVKPDESTQLAEPELCGDQEVIDEETLQKTLSRGGGMLSSAQKINNLRSSYLERKEKMEKRKNLKRVDHSSIIYDSVRKDVYREAQEIKHMSEAEVIQKRLQLGNIKIRGVNPVRPIFSWYHCGLPRRLLALLVDKLGFKSPFPVQCQCIPVILSGRDCIGVAETGSGKTLAYVLPMLRHVRVQPRLKDGDGPIGLVLVPTRELASQVFSTARLFAKVIGLKAAAIFGGSSMSSQFSELKKGADIVVSTPGRLIDILTTSKGKITNLRRVTFVVLDEADRMFDLGFEPQINRILGNIRPSKQTVLFSATFPRNIESLAKRILRQPLEVVVGNRGQASKNVEQSIEILPPKRKLFRLLELLGIWLDRGSVIIFIDRQEEGDKLFQDLVHYKYVPLLLHGGQDQEDRSNTLIEFKAQSKRALITTSLGARGLDIKSLILVVNYNCPTFKEDYIHRIGRTGRAGRKGYAVTFVTEDDDKLTGDLIQALQISNSEVPQELIEMHAGFRERVARGEVKDFRNSNQSGRGFKFDQDEAAKFRAIKKILSKQYGLEDGQELEQDEDVKYLKELEGKKVEKQQIKLIRDPKVRDAIKRAAVKAAGQAIMSGKQNDDILLAAQNAIRDFLLRYDPERPLHVGRGGETTDLQIRSGKLKHDEMAAKISVEFEIDNYPEITRKRITGRDYLAQISELTLCQISVRGIQSKNNQNVYGQKKLHIHIEGDSKVAVMNALHEINKTAEESANRAMGYNITN